MSENTNYRRDFCDVFNYILNRNEPFSNKKLNIIDNIILTQLSYIKWEHVIPNVYNSPFKRAIKLKDLVLPEYFPEMFSDDITDEENILLFLFATASKRYRDIKIIDFSEYKSEKEETQFAATTFELCREAIFVAFRGTDGDIVGWKENFNMAFMDEVPAQKLATAYLNDTVSKKMLRRNYEIYVGGHSKGGNLAEYAVAGCDAEIRRYIKKVFNNDGPSFRANVKKRIVETLNNDNVEVSKVVPFGSPVGMLLDRDKDYRIIDSKAKGIGNHAVFSWKIEGEDFIYKEDKFYGKEYMNDSINDWIESTDDEKRKEFVEKLFEILEKQNIRRFRDLNDEDLHLIKGSFSKFTDFSAEDKKMFLTILGSLLGSGVKNLPARAGKLAKKLVVDKLT